MSVKEFVDDVRKSISQANGLNEYNDIYNFVVKKAIRNDDFKFLTIRELDRVIHRTVDSIKSDVAVLKPYLDDDTISEIMVNGYKSIFVEKNGEIIKVDDGFLIQLN